eukprot:COSAG05_NODE_5448_length_1171_cov_12.171642_1_plen_336_part_10
MVAVEVKSNRDPNGNGGTGSAQCAAQQQAASRGHADAARQVTNEPPPEGMPSQQRRLLQEMSGSGTSYYEEEQKQLRRQAAELLRERMSSEPNPIDAAAWNPLPSAPTPKSIWQAAMQGDEAGLRDAIQATSEWQQLALVACHANGTTPIMAAARKSAACVKIIADACAEIGDFSVDTTDDLGNTALHHAVMGNQAECVRSLLSEYGANPNIVGSSNRTPLDLAVKLCLDTLVKILPEEDLVARTTHRVQTLLATHPGNICLSTYSEDYFASIDDKLKPAFLKCLASGIENPDSGMGCYACQPEDSAHLSHLQEAMYISRPTQQHRDIFIFGKSDN